MSFARQQPIKQEVIDLRSMLPDIAEMIGRALPILAIDNRIADDLWSVVADRSLFESAILNLAFNARDAMSGSGTLTIAAYNIAAGEGRPAAGPAGDCVAIVVTDTGSGMTPEVLVRAFEPFYTTKDAATGTGLGLSMVHDFAAQSGGTATIESEIGKGTSVAIHLPRAERLTLASAGPAA